MYNNFMIKLGAKELRITVPPEKHLAQLKKNPVYIVLDNVLDTYNVGAIFRLADAVSAKRIFLCAGTETPPNSRIKKASINTTEWVKWEYSQTAALAIQNLKSKIKHLKVFAIEQSKKSIPFDKADYQFPIALVVGHETDGVSKGALDLSDQIVEIPM